MDAALPLNDLSLESTDPVLAHVVRFARDVAWRHRRQVADPGRFRSALFGYYRAWRITSDENVPELEPRIVRVAVAAYREAHRELARSKSATTRAA